MTASIGVVGARGHVGKELLQLLDAHPGLRLSYLGSRALAGRALSEEVSGASRELQFESLEPGDLAGRAADVCVLALPNGLAAEYVSEIERHHPATVIIDLSADYRFDDGWVYGLPELGREPIRGARRIANPGCYATGMQLAIVPMLDELAGPPTCFGISGYSGAGTRPSPRNDPDLLTDNLMPYSLTGHLHEKEVSHRLARHVHFLPHVAPFFRGITLTVTMPLDAPSEREQIIERYQRQYGDEPLIEIVDEIPLVTEARHRHQVTLGGFVMSGDGRRVVVVATLDNLLKGAATVALQNINLACGFDELEGIDYARATVADR